MEKYAVPCIYNKISNHTLQAAVPGSKSITNRALLLATLAEGESLLRGALFSDDSRFFLSCIQELGFACEVDEEKRIVRVTGMGGAVPKEKASIYVGSAGTAARFLTAFLGLKGGEYHLDSSDQMKKRPMDSLLDSLIKLGAKVEFEGEEGHFPFVIKGAENLQKSDTIGEFEVAKDAGVEMENVTADLVTVDVNRSSQFLSALLISACRTGKDMKIQVEGDHGMAYVDMTVRMMEQFGVPVRKEGERIYCIDAGATYQALDYVIEPDLSAACYFYAMCPILGLTVIVEGVWKDSMQGDLRFLTLLEEMGCTLQENEKGLTLLPPKDGIYHGITADMSTCSDQAITMAATAVFADSPTTITGIGHIRFQESNRLQAIVDELTRMGIHCESTEDSVTIYPGNPQPALIETYEDHRMAMGFSLIGLRAEGIVINDPLCCKKTFENYFEVLDNIVAELCSNM